MAIAKAMTTETTSPSIDSCITQFIFSFWSHSIVHCFHSTVFLFAALQSPSLLTRKIKIAIYIRIDCLWRQIRDGGNDGDNQHIKRLLKTNAQQSVLANAIRRRIERSDMPQRSVVINFTSKRTRRIWCTVCATIAYVWFVCMAIVYSLQFTRLTISANSRYRIWTGTLSTIDLTWIHSSFLFPVSIWASECAACVSSLCCRFIYEHRTRSTY